MSTVRAFCNNKRVSTGRVMKNGSFFQAYPTHRVFPNEIEWMHHWKISSNEDFSFVDEGYEDMPPLIPAAPAPAPPAPISKEKRMVPMTQEHHKLLVEMLNTSITSVVNEWCSRSGFDVPVSPPLTPSQTTVATTPPPKPTRSSPPPITRKSSAKQNKSDWTYKEKYSFVAPPGTYYIGDICYFLPDNIYDVVYAGKDYESGIYTLKSDNSFFMVDDTAYGDGLYKGTDGFEYGVDAGIIGIASRSLGPKDDEKVHGGKLHTFKEPVEINFQKGLFRFKSNSKYLAIDTTGNTYNSDEDW